MKNQKNKQTKLYLELFLTFLKVSTFTIGGGYAMIPLLKSEIVEKKKWINDDELTDLITISQLVPGLIYVSTATSIGYGVAGVFGAIISSIAVLMPSTVSIMLLAYLMKDYFEMQVIKNIFIGIIAGVTALTGMVVYELFKKSVNSYLTIVILITSYILLDIFNIQTFLIIILGIISGIFYSYIRHNKERAND